MGEIVMPRLSDSMEQGTIIRWLKQDGDHVRRGEELVEIETDKASMPYESDQEGVLRILALEGSSHPVGAVIGQVGEATESSPAPAPAAVVEPVRVESVAASDTPLPAELPSDGRVKATPIARRLAQQLSVDLSLVSGSGPGGRVVRADVESAAGATPLEQPASGDAVAGSKRETFRQEIGRTQQTIARRMAESRATVPDFSVRLEVDIERSWDLLEQLRDVAVKEGSPKPSFNDLILRAVALALREYPKLNASYRDAGFEFHDRVNVGFAVATAEGLVVPTVFDTDRKSITEIAAESRKLVELTRSGKVTPPQLAGGTFTVSNLGMFGIDDFTAVISPPQAAILAVGAVAKRPFVYEGAVAVRRTVKFELACDHRIIYGADAAAFLAFLGELLAHPAVSL